MKKLKKIIINNRFLLFQILYETILYSPFGFYYLPSSIDTRGRLYFLGEALNIQNQSIVRSFVKPYVFENFKNIDKNNFNLIKNIVYNHLTNLKTNKFLKNLETMTFDNYLTEMDSKQKEYIYKHFTNISDHDFYSLLNSLEKDLINLKGPTKYAKIFEFLINKDIIKNLKKKKQLIEIASNIETYLNKNKKQHLLIGRDAKGNVFQLTGFLFNSLILGQKSNILGTKNNDIYNESKDFLKNKFDGLEILVANFCKLTGYTFQKSQKTFLNNEIYSELCLQTLTEKLHVFFSLNLSECSHIINFLKNLYEDFNKFNIFIEELSFSASFTFDSIMKDCITVIEQSNDLKFLHFVKILFSVKNAFKYSEKVLKKCPKLHEFLFIRELVKHVLMTYGYGAKAFNRKNHFYELLLRLEQELNFVIEEKELIITWLENAFLMYMSDHLPECENLQKFAKELSLLKEPIIIKNRNFLMELSPKKESKDVHRVQIFSNTNKNNKSTVNLKTFTKDIDDKAIKNSFSANYVHSMDAEIVHILYALIDQINTDLKKNKIPYRFFIFTIHDNYLSTNAFFLEYFINEAFLEFFKTPYIDTLNNNTPSIKEIIYKFFNPQTHRKNHKEFYNLLLKHNINPHYLS